MKKKIYTFKILILLLLLSACIKDFDEINTNPQGFTTASDGALFNALIESLQPGWNEQFYINNEILYKQTQQAALSRQAWGNYGIGTDELWRRYYEQMPAVRELQKRLDAYEQTPSTDHMRAMLKVVVALRTFKMTDFFGDMPYSMAGYGFEDLDNLRPEYDTQKDIYLALLDDLKWVDENIDIAASPEEPFISFSGFDLLFGGDMLQWKKLANSIRLRQAMRMAEAESELAGDIIGDIINENKAVFLGYDFLTPLLESACLWPAAMGFKNESLNWSFREHNNLRMGSVIWQQMASHDSTDGSGIFDPRAYIFFEPNNNNQWRAFPQQATPDTPPSGGIPYGAHRDQAGAFAIKGDNNIYSPFNYFLIRDEDYMPIILFTGAEVHFIKAEAYFRGIGVNQDKAQAEIEYFNGINSSVAWWRSVSQNLQLPVSGMAFNQMVNIPTWLNAATVQAHFGFWNAGSEEEKLQFLYTQRWLDAFRQPDQAYALLRRTSQTPHEGAREAHYRLPYPVSEAEYNTSNWASAIQNQGGDDFDSKLWWVP